MIARTCCAALIVLASLTQAQTTRPEADPRVYRASVRAHWLDATRFWYRNDLRDDGRAYILVDAEQGTKRPAFDHAALAIALADKIGHDIDAATLPLQITAADDASVTFVAFDKTWKWTPADRGLTETGPATRPVADAADRPDPRRRAPTADDGWASPAPLAPDGKTTFSLRAHNVYLNADASPLTRDGTEALSYEKAFWAPDSKHLVAFRLERGDHKLVYRIESSPPGANAVRNGPVRRAVLQESEYPLPGDKLDSYELSVIDTATGAAVKPAVDRIDADEWGSQPDPEIRWRPDGKRFVYEKYDRGHQRVRVIEVDVVTGAARDLMDEKSDTFIWTAHTEELGLKLFNYLANGRELIHVSEQSGWRHAQLIDLDTAVATPITSGNWVLRGIDRIDEEKRQLWFNASGVYADQDPYLIHYGRVNFDGTGLVWLTSSNGNHRIDFDADFSPGGQFVVVTHSRIDTVPVTELRRVSDGKRVVELETAEVGSDWKPPEVFVAKGRDGATDIWGVITRPRDFDPAKKYPVIEDIYAGPQGAYTPKSFRISNDWQALADLGFVVVKLDAMGTAMRSKAFHDVCWKNLADAGFPDRIAWIKAAAAKYPQLDTTRVGIYGGSAGGQNAAGALLFHNDFYKVAVANCGCHDNRMDKISWNEQWMGYPIGPQYSACSNIDNAEKLKGRLQLVLGELDDNVPVESTYRFIDALVKNGKEFEFVLIPGAGHGAASKITRRKRNDFFVRYLQDREPANPNP